jgi:hypothetical protein
VLTEVISHPLHLATIVANAWIALYNELELNVEVEGTSLTVAEELLLEGNPELLSDAAVGTCGLLEVDDDGVEQPRQDHNVIEGVALERQ